VSAVAGFARTLSTLACLVIIVSFALWAADEGREGSQAQVARIAETAAPAPTPTGEKQREAAHGDVREAIDDVDDVLLQPFAGIVDSNDKWAQRIVPVLLGLLAYGLVLRLLINYLPK
jgi:hypothetical protein